MPNEPAHSVFIPTEALDNMRAQLKTANPQHNHIGLIVIAVPFTMATGSFEDGGVALARNPSVFTDMGEGAVFPMLRAMVDREEYAVAFPDNGKPN